MLAFLVTTAKGRCDDCKITNAVREKEIPVWEKAALTLSEAEEYSGIGINKLRKISNKDDCPFVLFIGTKRLIKRKKLDEYIDKSYSI